LRERVYTTPRIIPKVAKGNTSDRLRWARAKTKPLITIADQTGRYRVRDGNKNPRNIISSKKGAATDAVTKNRVNASQS
jgi:hypothetical protein